MLAGGSWHVTGARQLLSPLIAMSTQFVLLLYLGEVNYMIIFCLPFPVSAVSAGLGAERDTPGWV